MDEATLCAAGRSLARKDPALRRLIRLSGPCLLIPGKQPDHLTALVRSIVFQQLSGKAASTIFSRVLALLPGGESSVIPSDWLSVADEDYRAAGLSRQKISYIRDLCERTADGRLPLAELGTMTDEQAVDVITQVRGFGRWSAHMYLMFHLGRPDVWPIDDLGIRKAVMALDRLSELPPPKSLMMRAELWRPYRSVAAWYLWRSLDVSPDDVGW